MPDRRWTIPKSAICPKDSKMLDEWEAVQHYYGVKHALAKRADAMRILEIGVRRGYSALAFLSARPDAEFIGIDNLSGTYGGTGDCYDWATRILGQFPGVTLLHADTQKMDRLFPATKFDLVHIDGDHSEAGCLHDMELCWPLLRRGGLMVVDDYDYQPAVRRAVEAFRSNNRNGYLGMIPYLEYGEDYRGEAIFQKPHLEGEMIERLLRNRARSMPLGQFLEVGCGDRSTPHFAKTIAPTSMLSFDLDAEKVAKLDASLQSHWIDNVRFVVGHSWQSLAVTVPILSSVSFAFFDSGNPDSYSKPPGGAVLTFGEFKMVEHLFKRGSCLLVDNAMLPEHQDDFCRSGTSQHKGYRSFPKGRILVPYLQASGRWEVTGYPHDAGGMVFAECLESFEGDFPPGARAWSIDKIDNFIRAQWAGENYDADTGYCRFAPTESQ